MMRSIQLFQGIFRRICNMELYPDCHASQDSVSDGVSSSILVDSNPEVGLFLAENVITRK